MIYIHFQSKPFNIIVIQVYALTNKAKEAEVYQLYKHIQNLLEITPPKNVFFIIGEWNAKEGSQETPGVTGKFGLGVEKEAGQKLIEFCQENTLVIANTLFQQHKRRLYTADCPCPMKLCMWKERSDGNGSWQLCLGSNWHTKKFLRQTICLVYKANHLLSRESKYMAPVLLKNLKLNGSMKTYKTF